MFPVIDAPVTLLPQNRLAWLPRPPALVTTLFIFHWWADSESASVRLSWLLRLPPTPLQVPAIFPLNLYWRHSSYYYHCDYVSYRVIPVPPISKRRFSTAESVHCLNAVYRQMERRPLVSLCHLIETDRDIELSELDTTIMYKKEFEFNRLLPSQMITLSWTIAFVRDSPWAYTDYPSYILIGSPWRVSTNDVYI